MQLQWSNEFQPRILYDLKRIEKFDFNQPTKTYLSDVGLPKEVAPFLSFVENNDLQYEGILRLTDISWFNKNHSRDGDFASIFLVKQVRLV